MIALKYLNNLKQILVSWANRLILTFAECRTMCRQAYTSLVTSVWKGLMYVYFRVGFGPCPSALLPQLSLNSHHLLHGNLNCSVWQKTDLAWSCSCSCDHLKTLWLLGYMWELTFNLFDWQVYYNLLWQWTDPFLVILLTVTPGNCFLLQQECAIITWGITVYTAVCGPASP